MSIDFSDKVPPHNLEAEQSVLGAMLIDREAISRVQALLSPDDFYADKHKALYQVMTNLYERGEPIDLITAIDELQKLDQLELVGGLPYLTTLANLVPTTANVEQYALIVEQKAILRRLQQTARRIADEAYASEEVAVTLARAEQAILEVTQKRGSRGYIHLREALDRAVEHIEHVYDNKGMATGVPSGFRDLDAMTSGFQPSDLIIIAARPSVGKTAFTLNVARNAALDGQATVAFFSLEMGAEQLAMRLLSAEAAVESQKLRSGYLTEEDWTRLSHALGRLSSAPIFIDDTPNIPLMELRARARRIQAEHGLGLVIIDYLQLMSLPKGRGGGSDNRQQEISEISRSLKQLARELRCPVIALSQLSRAVEQRQDKRPMLSDLRESGAIEQDADVVAFLYRDDYYDPESEKKNIVEVLVAKQRNGPVGNLDLYFMKEIGRFKDVETRAG